MLEREGRRLVDYDLERRMFGSLYCLALHVSGDDSVVGKELAEVAARGNGQLWPVRRHRACSLDLEVGNQSCASQRLEWSCSDMVLDTIGQGVLLKHQELVCVAREAGDDVDRERVRSGS